MWTINLLLVTSSVMISIILVIYLTLYYYCKKVVLFRIYTCVIFTIVPLIYPLVGPFIGEVSYALGLVVIFVAVSFHLIVNIKSFGECCILGLQSSEVFAIFDEKVRNLDPDEKLIFWGKYGKVEMRKDDIMEGVWYARFYERSSKIWFKEKISEMRSSIHCGIISCFVIFILVFSLPAMLHFFYFN